MQLKFTFISAVIALSLNGMDFNEENSSKKKVVCVPKSKRIKKVVCVPESKRIKKIDQTDYKKYKKAFKLWLSEEGKCAFKIYWKALKEKIKKQEVRFNPAIKDNNNPERVGFVAYTGSIDNENKEICLLISPSWMFSVIMGMVGEKPEWMTAYAIAFVKDTSFAAMGFERCNFNKKSKKLKNSELLPKYLHPKKGSMPGWKNPIAFNIWMKKAHSSNEPLIQHNEQRERLDTTEK